MTIVLAEIGYVTAGGTTGTLRLCNGGGYNHPSAPGYYQPRIIRGGGFTRALWQGGAALGTAAQMGWGELLVAHLDADQAGRNTNLLWLISQGCCFPDADRCR